MSINVELGFLSELISSGDLTTVIDLGINHKYLNGKNKKALKFITEHQAKYGKVPSLEIFEKKFPTIELINDDDGVVGTEESLRYWCDELRVKLKHNSLVDGLELCSEKIEELDTDEAYKILKQTVLKIENDVVLSDRIKINENTVKRMEEYLARQKSGGITGIPSYIKDWDELIGGYNKGELITAIGYTGLGKSWWICIQAVAMAKAGYKVLLFTTEMSTKMVMRRIDAIWCGLNYSNFKKGQLKPDQQKRYFKYLKEMEGNEETNLVVEQATGGISQVSAKIDQYDPDIIFIDGAYLLEDEEGEEDNWMGMVRIWRGLHRLALLKNRPIVVTSQSKDESGATLKSMSFAKAISNDCDVVVVLEQDEQQRLEKEVTMRPLKIREGDIRFNVHLNWDFDKMDYAPIFKERQVEEVNVKQSGVITIE